MSVDEIAEFLNVTPGYLIKGNTINADIEDMTPIQAEIVKNLKLFSVEKQKAILYMIEKFV